MIKKTLLGLTLLVSLSIQGQDEASITLETLSQSAIEEHIYFLASDELKGRETGSPEIDIAAEYLATTLRRFGVQSVPGAQEGYFQAVELETVQPAASKRLILGDFTTENVLVMSGSNMERSMEAVFVDHGLEKDYENKDVAGKLAVALVGKEGANDPNSSFGLAGSKRTIAKRKGAVGLIEINTFGAVYGIALLTILDELAPRLKPRRPVILSTFGCRTKMRGSRPPLKRKRQLLKLALPECPEH